MTTLDEILSFFSQNQIPILPCFGILNGICTCKRGAQCPSPGKHPLMFRWQMLASCDKDVIKGWLSGNGKPVNLAIRTGTRNSLNGKYLVGTDLDLVDHPMKEKLSQYSTTVTQQSGSGGAHAFYWSEVPVRNSVQLIDEKMDIRGSGGIIVIAPSMHITGRPYEFTCDLKTTKIQDFPEFLLQKLKTATIERKKVETSFEERTKNDNKRVTLPDSVFNFWSLQSILTIKNAFLHGKKVPVGARNATMHRLLSSERAKGIPSATKLLEKARDYLPNFSDPESFEEELSSIVKSVMRYPAYNNSHEKVNELYIGWLGKHGYKSHAALDALNELDEKFFSTLSPGSPFSAGVSLKEISDKRAEFLTAAGLEKFATYRPQLLAKKLLSLGIERKRSAKGNTWQVQFKHVSSPAGVCQTQEKQPEPTVTMSVNLPKNGEIIEKNGKKFRVELVAGKRTVQEHPREYLYQGKKGYEHNKALRELLQKLTEDQIEDLGKGKERTVLLNENRTKEWISSVKTGDVIGVVETPYIVLSTDNQPSKIQVTKAVRVPSEYSNPGVFKSTSQPMSLTAQEIDYACALGLLDILWRDGKPFGVEAELDTTIILTHPLENKKGKSNGDV